MKIEIYSTKTCTYCKKAKDYFDSKGLEYEVKMVDENPEYMNELTEMGFMSVPVIVMNDQIIKGFNKDVIEHLLTK